MSTSDLRWIVGHPPEMTDPVLVVVLTGWIDTGGAAAAAVATIAEECGADPVATFDDDAFIDFRARRPILELREGLSSVLRWQEITASVARDRAGHDLVLLTGPEPDMAWHRFGRIVVDLATTLGVRTMVSLGAYPFTTPHTRPSQISITTPSQDVLARSPFARSSIDVPAGASALIAHVLHEVGIPSLGLWAQVPHYINSLDYPAAGVALLDALRDAVDVVIDATDLRVAAADQRARLDALVAQNAEHAEMLRQLETLHDAAEPTGTPSSGSTLPMTSGDELAAELERFLRDQPPAAD